MRRKAVTAAAITGIAAFAIGAAALTPNAAKKAKASSHREAPLIANDPTADLTDLYAFMSPGKTDMVTLMANVIPIEIPAEGPNYYNLDDTVQYRIEVDNNGDGKGDLHFALRTKTHYAPGTFLYNTGPVTSLNSPNLAVKQRWTLTLAKGNGSAHVVARGDTAPNNVGKTSMPDYAALAASAVKSGNALGHANNVKVFVGPREDPFAIDVGRIFDFLSVGGLGTDNLKGVNVHTIAIEVPGSLLRKSTSQPVIGVWAATDRQVVRTVTKRRHGKRVRVRVKQWKQVERLGQPLVNEVLIPRTLKDYWNTQTPAQDKQFEKYYTAPGLIKALNARVFGPVLDAALGCGAACPVAQETGRADLSAILLRGFNFGNGAVDLTFGNTGSDKKPVDELRLNTKTQPVGTSSAVADRRGLICNFQTPTTGPLGPTLHSLDIPPCSPAQFDGYPNGRRLGDDVTDIQIAAIAGLPIDGLIPAGIQRPYGLLAMGLGTDTTNAGLQLLRFGADGVLNNDKPFTNTFPYAALPNSGNP
jgi:Domain of unknown function (DUF4331)